MTTSDTVARILALQGVLAAKAGDPTRSAPGRPASEAAIAGAEASRGVTFPPDYRAFLAAHDGWTQFSWGTHLYSTAQLTGDAYARGYLQEMIDEGDADVTDELREATVIGGSENDASLVILLPDGSVINWKYEEESRAPSFTAYLAAHAQLLQELIERANAQESIVERDGDPAARVAANAALASELAAVLAAAPPRSPGRAPAAATPPPAAVMPSDLVARRGDTVVAEVMQHLVLYLGAYPRRDEVIGAFRAWRGAYPVTGDYHWMLPSSFFPEPAKSLDEALWVPQLRIDRGHYGIRASVDATREGRTARYVLNIRGVPPTTDDEAQPRASFVEVIVPASEDPATLQRLAGALLALLPVRSGHGGYAAYVWSERERPVATEDVFAWCRRFFGLEVGGVDGWLTGTRSRVRGAGWLTLLGPAFTEALGDRLAFGADISVVRTSAGALITAGARPTLGDVQRGEFPTAIASVEAVLAPLALRRYDERGEGNIGGRRFATLTEELAPFRSHAATLAYLDRLLEPAAFLAPTARERAEPLLAALTTPSNAIYRDAWRDQVATGTPQLGDLLRNLYNATINQADSDDAIAALELAIAFPDTGQPHHALSNLLFGHLQRWLRDKQPLDRALALIPRAETWGALWPMILHNAACVCACAGELAAAVRCVDLAKQAGYTNLEGLLDDDDLAPVRTAGLLLAYGR